MLDKWLDWLYVTESPKGRLRFKEFAILAVALLAFAYCVDSQMLIGWLAQTIMLFFKASLAVVFTYCVFRIRLHERNHELVPEDKRNRELAEIIGYCFVIGCALAI
jgi:hypothetical protein